MEKSYSEKELVRATEKGSLYDYIADHYHEMSAYDLKEVLLAVIGVGLDSCTSKAEENAYARKIVNELNFRGFGEE